MGVDERQGGYKLDFCRDLDFSAIDVHMESLLSSLDFEHLIH